LPIITLTLTRQNIALTPAFAARFGAILHRYRTVSWAERTVSGR